VSWASVRDAAQTIVAGVADIGQVHGYQRYAKNPLDYKALFKDPDSGRIRCAMLTRQGASARRLAHRRNEVTHTLAVLVLEGVNDGEESESTFRARVEGVRVALDRSETSAGALGGAALSQEPAEVATEEFRVFGDVFCHYGVVRCRVAAAEDLP